MCAATSLHSGVMDYSAMHWRFLLTGEETWFDSVILADEWTDVHVCHFVWALRTLQHVSLPCLWLWFDLLSLISELINVIVHLPTLCSAFVPSWPVFFSVVPGGEISDPIFRWHLPQKSGLNLPHCLQTAFFSHCPFESGKMCRAIILLHFSHLGAIPVSHEIRLTRHTNAHLVMSEGTRTTIMSVRATKA